MQRKSYRLQADALSGNVIDNGDVDADLAQLALTVPVMGATAATLLRQA